MVHPNTEPVRYSSPHCIPAPIEIKMSEKSNVRISGFQNSDGYYCIVFSSYLYRQVRLHEGLLLTQPLQLRIQVSSLLRLLPQIGLDLVVTILQLSIVDTQHRHLTFLVLHCRFGPTFSLFLVCQHVFKSFESFGLLSTGVVDDVIADVTSRVVGVID